MVTYTASGIGGARTPQCVEGTVECWRRRPTRRKGPRLVLTRKAGVAKLRDEDRRGSKKTRLWRYHRLSTAMGVESYRTLQVHHTTDIYNKRFATTAHPCTTALTGICGGANSVLDAYWLCPHFWRFSGLPCGGTVETCRMTRRWRYVVWNATCGLH